MILLALKSSEHAGRACAVARSAGGTTVVNPPAEKTTAPDETIDVRSQSEWGPKRGRLQKTGISDLDTRLTQGTRPAPRNTRNFSPDGSSWMSRNFPTACFSRPARLSRRYAVDLSHTPPTVISQNHNFALVTDRSAHPAVAAPRSGAAYPRTASGSDAPRPTRASKTVRLLDHPPARLHQPLLQARQRPVPDPAEADRASA